MQHIPIAVRILVIIAVVSSVSTAASATAVLDSLAGSAEVQRAGSVKWVPIERDAHLFNNDVIRIPQGSFGVIRWPDNSQAYAYGGTQILVNIGPENSQKILSYATVFVGSVFFVIKQILPQKLAQDIQVFTPTTVISIRGTSFSVGVAENSGASTIKMVCGTVRVRSIKQNVSAFISAPYKTEVTKKTTQITTSALLNADMDSLKQWVPASVINFEINKQLAKSKRDRLILTETMYEKCNVISFANTSSYKGQWDIGRFVPTSLARRICKETNRLEIIPPDSVNPIKTKSDAHTGTALPRFIIAGSITTFAIVDHAEISVRADEYHERSIGRVSLQLILSDSRNPDEKDTINVTGERSGRKNIDNSWATIDKYKCSFDDDRFSSSIIGSALDQALDAAAEKMIMKMYE